MRAHCSTSQPDGLKKETFVTPGVHSRPEKVLLFKGLQTHQADFATAAPFLSMESRRWLAAALAHAKGDDHPWIPALR